MTWKWKKVDKFFDIKFTEPISLFICVCAKFHNFILLLGKYCLVQKSKLLLGKYYYVWSTVSHLYHIIANNSNINAHVRFSVPADEHCDTPDAIRYQQMLIKQGVKYWILRHYIVSWGSDDQKSGDFLSYSLQLWITITIVIIL